MRIVSFLVVFAMAWTVARAEDPVAKQVDRLIRKLDAESRVERDRADADLLKLGPAALPHLPPLDAKELTAEQRNRLGRLVLKLWKVKLTRDVGGTPIALPAAKRPLVDVLRDLEKQSGNAIKDLREEFRQETSNPTIECDGKPRFFWESLDRACDQVNLTPYPFRDDRMVGLRAAQISPPPRTYAGAFRFALDRLSIERDFANAQKPECILRIAALVEPRLRPVQVDLDPATLTVVDDKGRAVPPLDKRLLTFGIDEKAYHFTMVVKLAAPPRDAVKLAKATGTIAVQLPTTVERFEFADWSDPKGASKEAAGLRVRVKDARDEGDGIWSFRVVTEVLGDRLESESHLGSSLEPEIGLQKSSGPVLPPNGGRNTKEDTAARTDIEYLYTGIEGKMQDYRLILKIPAGVTRVPVTFTFENLPLP